MSCIRISNIAPFETREPGLARVAGEVEGDRDGGETPKVKVKAKPFIYEQKKDELRILGD